VITSTARAWLCGSHVLELGGSWPSGLLASVGIVMTLLADLLLLAAPLLGGDSRCIDVVGGAGTMMLWRP
jgi:hypothetical protein